MKNKELYCLPAECAILNAEEMTYICGGATKKKYRGNAAKSLIVDMVADALGSYGKASAWWGACVLASLSMEYTTVFGFVVAIASLGIATWNTGFLLNQGYAAVTATYKLNKNGYFYCKIEKLGKRKVYWVS